MSDDAPASSDSDSDDGIDVKGLGVAVVAVACLGLFWMLGPAWKLAYLFAEVVVISIVIWQACDPFADAAQWIGETFKLPGSVRGATLDAIASSMPELFSGIFFVLIAVTAVGEGGTQQALEAAGAEGYGATIATCAGSAVYNMMLIPAVCALVISFYRTSRPVIDVEDDVIARDGLWFVCCEILLILFLFQDQMYWWMGLVFIGLYVVYIVQLSRDAGKFRGKMAKVREHLEGPGAEADEDTVVRDLKESGVRVSRAHVIKAREGDGEEEDDDSAGILFGVADVPLNMVTAWTVIVVSTAFAAGACYFLVDATRAAATELGVPTFFVAVIVAAAASSVPDTFLSIGSAMRGDDSGAVSNAFGSNIFDICICLSIPLLVNSYLTGWQPVSLLQDGEPIPGLVGLRILLVVLTIVTLAIIWHNRQLTRTKAFVLCGLYGVFIAYAVLGSLGVLF